jgi:hypothetical protein
MFSVYLAAIPPVTIWAMLNGLVSDRRELMRCGAVVLGHAFVTQAWWWLAAPDQWAGYPFLFMAVTLAIVLRLICMVPASRGNAVLAGSVLFGILASLIYGVHTLISGASQHADWTYGLAQFVMGWANLIILLGWTHERALRSVVDPVLSAAARLVQPARFGGLAR